MYSDDIIRRLSKAEHDRDRYKRRIDELQDWLSIARDNAVRCGECQCFASSTGDIGCCSDLGIMVREKQTCFMGEKKARFEG